MKNTSLVAALIGAIIITGCINIRMYEGPEKSIAEIGRFFSDGSRPNLRIMTIDQKTLSFVMTKVLQLSPGTHVFDIQASTIQESGTLILPIGKMVTAIDLRSQSKSYDKGLYRIEVPIRSGYTYIIDYPLYYSGPLPEKLCILGEPHKASGSWENITGEERKMSRQAEVVACGTVRDKTHVGP